MVSYKNELNVLHHYFDRDSAIYKIMGDIRKGFLNNTKRKLDNVEAAITEVGTKRHALDVSTYAFAQGLSKHLYGGSNVRVVLLVDGKFGGAESIDSVVAIDLGRNPHDLFEDVWRGTTIDRYVSDRETMDFIRDNRSDLLERGFSYFDTKMAKFFYLLERDLKGFMNEQGNLDMAKLVPFLTPTRYVVLDEVEKPSLPEYVESAPTFASYRLKQSVARKLLTKLRSEQRIGPVSGSASGKTEHNVITDWVAHRIVVETKDEMNELFRFFKTNPRIGNSQVEFIYPKDYYESGDIEGGKFKAKLVIARVSTKSFVPCIREIQFIDKAQYYLNEFGTGRGEHKDHRKKQSQVPRSKKTLSDYYEPILERIFGREETRIDIL